MNRSVNGVLLKALLYFLMIVLVALCLFPVLWMCAISFKTVGESITGFQALRIETPTLANYQRLFRLIPWSNLYNSVFTTALGTISVLRPGGFASKIRRPAVIATMTIAPEPVPFPVCDHAKNRADQPLWSLILPRIATAVGTTCSTSPRCPTRSEASRTTDGDPGSSSG